MRKNLIFSLLFFSIIFLISIPSTKAVIHFSNCRKLNQEGETYILDNDLSNQPGICINITANNITLDCQGHSIIGCTNLCYYGILVSRNTLENTNITIKNCSVKKWLRGIEFIKSNNNTILNVTANHNYFFGIRLSTSKNNIIVNSIFSNNNYGIELTGGAHYNEIYSNTIQNNSAAGIYIYASYDNLIYNNLFNNTKNAEISTYENYWNTTKKEGNRIYLPGSYIGGNYWTNSTGNGFSDTCADYNSDGICDEVYDVYNDSSCTPGINCSNNVDFLPLSQVAPANFSKVQRIISKNFVYNGSEVEVFCKVVNNFSLTPIEGYNVSFYKNNTFLGWSLTNASGYANISFFDDTVEPPKNYILECNITDAPELNYNASEENSKSMTLKVINLGINVFSFPSIVDYGNTVEIIANISGNASGIQKVEANISFTNISEGKLVKTFEIKNLTLKKTFSEIEHQYNLTFIPSRSGDYRINITVYAERIKSNTTEFDVSFGSPLISFIFPNYRILANQTFNFTVKITATNGDLWFTNLTLSITNETVLNITQTFQNPNLFNISNSKNIFANWSMQSLAKGPTQVILNVTPLNGSSEKTFSSHYVVNPILEANDTNITHGTIILTKIVGNTTPIVSVNLSIAIPYYPDITKTAAFYFKTESEENCTGEKLAVERLTLLPNASCSGEDCNNTIDSQENSFMLAYSGNELIITLNSEQWIEKILLLWTNATSDRNGNTTIYYNSSGTWRSIPELTELVSPTEKGYTNITGFTPFKTNAFKLNHTGSIYNKIYEFEAYSIPPKVGVCYVYGFNFSNTIRSGTYSFNSTVHTQNQNSITANSSFFVNFGTPAISIISPYTPETMLKNHVYTYKAYIKAVNGDLRNLTVNLTVYNTTVLNITDENPKAVLEILNENTMEVTWSVKATENGITNTSVSANSTTGKGNYNISSNFTITVTSNPGDLPNITNFWFEYSGIKTDKTNLFTNLTIFANVSDDVSIKEVKANITYPFNMLSINASMEFFSKTGNWEIWKYTFGDELLLNKTGNYTIRIVAIDIGDQEKVSGIDENSPENKTFNVNNTLILELTSPPSPLMGGENITVNAKYVNGVTAESVNWTVNITKINTLYSESIVTTIYEYQIKPDDPTGNYSIFINATKNGNSGNISFEFNVSKNYTVELGKISPSPPISGAGIDLYFTLRDARGGYPLENVYGYLTCFNGTSDETFIIVFSAGSGSDNEHCFAPSSSFTVKINVSDDFNNFGENSFTFTPKSLEVKEVPVGVGSATPAPVCEPEADYEINCTDEKDNDCDGATDCSDPDCSEFYACIPQIIDFNFTVSKNEVEITQGENGTLIGSVNNLGNVKLTIGPVVEIEKNCCSVFAPSLIQLQEKVAFDFPIIIHVYSFTEPGEYVITIKMKYGGLENTRSMKIKVKRNEIIYYIFEELPKKIPDMQREINELKEVGLNVKNLENKIKEITQLVEKSREDVQQDNIESVKSNYEKIKSSMKLIESEISKLEFQKFIYKNKWNIVTTVSLGAISAYLIGFILIPFIKISTEITRLSFEEASLVRSRKIAEAQYFLRKIDEKTFRKIIEEKHSKILKIRSSISLKKKERKELIKKRLNPLSLIKYVKEKLRK